MSEIKQGCQTLAPVPQAYSVREPAKFNSEGVMYWHMVNYIKTIDSRDQLLAMIAATNAWNIELKKYNKIIIPTKDIKKAHTLIYAVSEDGTAHLNNGKKWRPPAPVYDHQIGWQLGNLIVINIKTFIREKKSKGSEFLEDFFIHEWGHRISLEHTEAEDDIMYFKTGKKRKITEDSKLGLEVVYGLIKNQPQALVYKSASVWKWIKKSLWLALACLVAWLCYNLGDIFESIIYYLS